MFLPIVLSKGTLQTIFSSMQAEALLIILKTREANKTTSSKSPLLLQINVLTLPASEEIDQ
jgi:hypothetical protein